jgi:hypothetical protein
MTTRLFGMIEAIRLKPLLLIPELHYELLKN